MSALGQSNPPTQLLPDALNQVLLAKYICVAVLSAWVWDFLLGLDEDVALFQLRGRHISLVYLIYNITRICSLLIIVLILACSFMQYAHCNALVKSIAATIAVAFPLSSLLMYFRVYVVYHDSPFFKSAFGVMWLGVAGASVFDPFSAQGVSIAGQCMPIHLNSNGTAGISASAVYDSLIFFAISYRLLAFHSQTDSWKGRMKSFFRGEALFKTSRLLLQTGQLYYAATVGINILAVVGGLSSGLPPLIRTAFTIPALALTTNMACKVYRSTRLGMIRDSVTYNESVSGYLLSIGQYST